MYRIPIFLFILILLATPSGQAVADELEAVQIFDAMVHYESDQLESNPAINDFSCSITQTAIRAGIDTPRITEKTMYFMLPNYQLYMVDDNLVNYFDDSLINVTLDTNDLTRERDAEIDGIPCYVIKTQPIPAAFRKFSKTYFVAKDDFRHVLTVSHESNDYYDDLFTQIEYEYREINGFLMLYTEHVEYRDEDDDLIATANTIYSDYQFSTGITLEWIHEQTEGGSDPIPPWN